MLGWNFDNLFIYSFIYVFMVFVILFFSYWRTSAAPHAVSVSWSSLVILYPWSHMCPTDSGETLQYPTDLNELFVWTTAKSRCLCTVRLMTSSTWQQLSPSVPPGARHQGVSHQGVGQWVGHDWPINISMLWRGEEPWELRQNPCRAHGNSK